MCLGALLTCLYAHPSGVRAHAQRHHVRHHPRYLRYSRAEPDGGRCVVKAAVCLSTPPFPPPPPRSSFFASYSLCPLRFLVCSNRFRRMCKPRFSYIFYFLYYYTVSCYLPCSHARVVFPQASPSPRFSGHTCRPSGRSLSPLSSPPPSTRLPLRRNN